MLEEGFSLSLGQRGRIDDQWCLTMEEACMIHSETGIKALRSCLWCSAFPSSLFSKPVREEETDSPAAFWQWSVALVPRL